MARCRVRYTNDQGVHSFEVTADTLFEAEDYKTVSEPPGSETEFTVQILRKPVEHMIRLRKIQDWAQLSSRGGQAEIVRRERLRKMLGTTGSRRRNYIWHS